MSTLPTGPERPIGDQSTDKLGRTEFVKRLASALVEPETRKSTGVVVGIAGPWGSGKSSILNLLETHLRDRYEDALLVRFDPWLVSGRDDLIGEFLGELIATINSGKKRSDKIKKFGRKLASYGARLAVAGDLWLPGAGSAAGEGLAALEKALSENKTLNEMRKDLTENLEELYVPIVVFIDEIDRVEDHEIRAVAQLVRSVADFPGISYLLAYDPERVIQALGADAPEQDQTTRGRNYLEKIVQFQIPLPTIFPHEMGEFINRDLQQLTEQLKLPNLFWRESRYGRLLDLMGQDVIQTLRDTRRLVCTFHVLAPMLHGEVDWVDLLGYSALLVKSPQTAAKMASDPWDFLQIGGISSIGLDRPTIENWFDIVVPEAERNKATKELLSFLFPTTFDENGIPNRHADALSTHRPLITTLRLGLLPGAYSRADMHSLVNSTSEEVSKRLTNAQDNRSIARLTDRLSEAYSQLVPFDQIRFWKGVASFAKKPNCEWLQTYPETLDSVRRLVNVLEVAVRSNESLREEAANVFRALLRDGEAELTAFWLRHHIFAYGLFKRDKRPDIGVFLDEQETEKRSLALAEHWLNDHKSGKLIPCRWSLQPVYTLIDMELWDRQCRDIVDGAIVDDRAVDGLSLMLFGGNFGSDKDTIDKICSYSTYIDRARERLLATDLDPAVQLALNKALGNER